MSEEKRIVPATAIEAALARGDLSQLTANERVAYLKSVCESLGLNPLTRPFDYITLNGKITLYAKKDATDQLREKHNVSVVISSRDMLEGVYVVTAKATLPGGRCDESVGAVSIQGLKGDHLANAVMKAETKAKRRVTLSICGLGILDESEAETIPDAKPSPPLELKKNLPPPPSEDDPGNYIVMIGTKNKGKRLADIPLDDIAWFQNYLFENARKNNKPLVGFAKEFMEMADKYWASLDDNEEEAFPFEKEGK